MKHRSCPSSSRQESRTAPAYNTCQHNRDTSEEKPTQHRSGNTSSPRRQKRGANRHEPSGQDQSDDDECPDESKRKKPRLRGSAADKNHDGLSLACPFYKVDKRNHNRCALLQLNRIRDVKQHLCRKHSQPHYCSRCGREFETQEEERRHTRQQDCTKRANQPPEGITHDQQRDLKERVDRKLAVEQQWFAVWDIVFPGKQRPRSPYVYSPTREVATNMRSYWQETTAEMLADRASRVPGVDSERIISGLNTFIKIFFDRFIEEHTSSTEGEQVSDSSSDGSPGTVISSGRTSAISTPGNGQTPLLESFRDLLSVMGGTGNQNFMLDGDSMFTDYQSLGVADQQWEITPSDDAYEWDEFPTTGPYFHGDPLT
ncbi:hypothetical protein BDP81DRAFT_471540 [Colletotrichum phormii]|uniref:C2H2-type domain-containing protein n=1 Tax=Colletotrichum phormii TaxID=359342 RepID=A0AAJ0EF20_9PEZI|nr:uncharacterized protein BDP81DRAFT_471540 [Colletotrichum phormii]KAK1636473.1 hypothetical protein BDP81DRAFT_471540 [Colletotrichum phormii]